MVYPKEALLQRLYESKNVYVSCIATIYSVDVVDELEVEVASELPLSVLLFLDAGTGSTMGVRE